MLADLHTHTNTSHGHHSAAEMYEAAVTAGLGGDAPLLVAIALVSACVVFAGNACADMLYAFIDPRIREGRGPRDA